MAKQLLRESVWTSQKLARCRLETHMAFPFLLPIGNHWGLFELDYRSIWQKVAAYRDDLEPGKVTLWLKELEDEGLFKRYSGPDGKLYGAWLNFEGIAISQRSASLVPPPAFDNSKRIEEIEPGWMSPRERVGGAYPLSRSDLYIGVVEEKEKEEKQEKEDISARTSRRPAKAVPAVLDTELNRATIDSYNGIFGTSIGYTRGNLQAASRAFGAGYVIAQFWLVFQAVKDRSTKTAEWCDRENHDFEYLIRPPYRHRESGETIIGPLDKILNELASGDRGKPVAPSSPQIRSREDAARAGIEGGLKPTTSKILEGMRRDRGSLERGNDATGSELARLREIAGHESGSGGDAPSGVEPPLGRDLGLRGARSNS